MSIIIAVIFLGFVKVVKVIKEILFLLALLNLVFISVSIYKRKSNLALALGILEIIIVYFASFF